MARSLTHGYQITSINLTFAQKITIFFEISLAQGKREGDMFIQYVRSHKQ